MEYFIEPCCSKNMMDTFHWCTHSHYNQKKKKRKKDFRRWDFEDLSDLSICSFSIILMYRQTGPTKTTKNHVMKQKNGSIRWHKVT